MSSPVDQYIRGIEIAMLDQPLVGILHSCADLLEQLQTPLQIGALTRTRTVNVDTAANAPQAQTLTSPAAGAIVLPPPAQRPILFSFDSHHRYESNGPDICVDGGFVEISTNSGTSFTLLDNSRNLADPYQGET